MAKKRNIESASVFERSGIRAIRVRAIEIRLQYRGEGGSRLLPFRTVLFYVVSNTISGLLHVVPIAQNHDRFICDVAVDFYQCNEFQRFKHKRVRKYFDKHNSIVVLYIRSNLFD